MEAYVHISNDFSVEVEVKNSPVYRNEIIIGGERLAIFGVKMKDISTIAIFPGVKTWARVKTNNTTLIGIVQRSNLGMILPLTVE